MTKHLKEDSASYLKSWLNSLKESPEFLKTTLVDVKKASGMITRCIDDIQLKIDNGEDLSNKATNKENSENESSDIELGLASKDIPKQEEEIERPRWHR